MCCIGATEHMCLFFFFFCFWISTQHTCFSCLESVFWFFFFAFGWKTETYDFISTQQTEKRLLWNTNDSIRKYFKRHWKHSVEGSRIVSLLVAKLWALEWGTPAVRSCGNNSISLTDSVSCLASFCCRSVAQLCPTLRPHGLQPIRLPCPSVYSRFTQTHGHWVNDVIQPSRPLLPRSSHPYYYIS